MTTKGASNIAGHLHPTETQFAGGFSICFTLSAAVGFFVCAGLAFPPYLQPTLVGILWGGASITGFVAGSPSANRSQIFLTLLACAFGIGWACNCLTDLNMQESRQMVAWVSFGGWCLAKFDCLTNPSKESRFSLWRWTTWDWLLLVFFFAIGCHRTVEPDPSLAMEQYIYPTIWCGITVSWLAIRMAKPSTTHQNSYFSWATLLAIGFSAAWLWSSLPQEPLHNQLVWLISRPLNVIATQFSTVVLFCGCNLLQGIKNT
ncbi:MAG: hypothetical protein KDB03_03695 [Planctomycetales bacterium]|nr:hypothetical protein [Planctomycetales bacterium]